MPGRLLMAAEILLDVARTVNAADRRLLETAAAELTDRATEMFAKQTLPCRVTPNSAAMWWSQFRIPAGLDRATGETTSSH